MSNISPFSKQELTPHPETLEIKKNKGQLFVGLPKESFFEEKRISLTPDAVSVLVANGHRIIIETGAGLGAKYSDKEYSEAGAKIAYNKKDAFQCNIVLKVEPPLIEEIKLMNPETLLISSLQLKIQKKEYFDCLINKKITAVAYDFLKDEDNSYPVLKSLSEIAGNASIQIASELMTSLNNGNGLLFGNITGVSPTNVVILGAGMVGKTAAKTATKLGARVKVFDNSITKLRKLQEVLHYPGSTSTVNPKSLNKALMNAEVVIGAIRGKERSPIIVSEDMVQTMKDGAIIVDVSIDRGGCFETSSVTTLSKPTFIKHGVIHYCVPNIPSRYSRTASISISNTFLPFLMRIAEEGGFLNAIRFDKTLRSGIYIYKGILSNKTVAEWFDMIHRDINLLIL